MNNIQNVSNVDVINLLQVVQQKGIEAVDLSNKEVFDLFEMITVAAEQFNDKVWRNNYVG